MTCALILLNFQNSVSAKESESTNVCANKCDTIDLIEESTFINDDGKDVSRCIQLLVMDIGNTM